MAFTGLTAFAPDDEIDEDNVFQFQSNGLVQVIEGRIGIEVKPEWGTAGFRDHMRGTQLVHCSADALGGLVMNLSA
jgi:hypothetical protein